MERKRPQTPWFDRLITHCSIPSLHFSLGLFRSVLSHSVFALPAGLEGLIPSMLSKAKDKRAVARILFREFEASSFRL